MLLKHFSYYFSFKGTQGGVFSLDFEFVPNIQEAEDGNIGNHKTLVKEYFSKLEALLDEALLTHPLLKIKKLPMLVDDPHSVETGYSYEGEVVNKNNMVSILKNAFPYVFGSDKKELPSIGSLDPFTRLSAKVTCRWVKIGSDSRLPQITLNSTLGHDFNLRLFQSVLELPQLHPSREAQIELDRLERIRAMGKDADPKKFLDSAF